MRPTGNRTAAFGRDVVTPKALDPETNPWWWHPSRPGVPSGPPSFTKALEAIDPNLAVTRNNFTGRYQIWERSPRLQHKVCWGWKLLLGSERADGELLGRLHEMDKLKYGGAKAYFDAVQRDMERDAASRKRKHDNETMTEMTERGWDHTRISTAGKGNKGHLYHW